MPPHCIPCLSIFGENSVEDSGAKALAALKDAPSLHTLSLGLGRNPVGDSGAQALATLKSHLAQITATYLLHPSQETEEVM